ncbi:hypothetical protein [Larsenimonas rhizosphaerae]|uniref:hypothetical protein n=1 Tax=Larsenimonas rhizosphaerae TaxID=2944682 RepID=UPI002033EF93|nr:hypothetical protein [Larsenimonas rhizosphaerae]MCM2131454.1 hypothetical protein [Larsenimonas rhizosphaerae]
MDTPLKTRSVKADLIGRFLIQWIFGFVIISVLLEWVGHYYDPSNAEFLGSIKNLRVDVFITLGVGMLALLTFKKDSNISVACAALFSITLALSSAAMQLVPADVRIADDFWGQTLIFLPLTSMLSSLIWMSLNLIWAILKAV